MQRQIRIARSYQVMDLLRRPVALVEIDGCSRGTLTQLPVSVRIGRPVDGLEDEPHILPLRKRTPECRNDRVGVLPWEMTVDVEHEREHEGAIADVQPPATSETRAACGRYNGRNAYDRHWRNRTQRRGDEGGPDPDFVVVGEAVVPALRKVRQLPCPCADVVVVGKERLPDLR